MEQKMLGGDSRPGPVARRPLKVLHAETWWIVSRGYVEVAVHWTGARSRPCLLNLGHDKCQDCIDKYPVNLEFWISLQDLRARSRPSLCKLTPGVIELTPGLVLHNHALYGRQIELWRKNLLKSGPMMARLITPEPGGPRLAETIDVWRELNALWGGVLRQPRMGEDGRPLEKPPGLGDYRPECGLGGE